MSQRDKFAGFPSCSFVWLVVRLEQYSGFDDWAAPLTFGTMKDSICGFKMVGAVLG